MQRWAWEIDVMAEDWLSDVRKYSFEADEDVVGSIVYRTRQT